MAETAAVEAPRGGPSAGVRPSEFEYVFPAIRGIQAGHEYYVTMCPLRLIPRLFVFDEDELPPEMRAQRSLNKAAYQRWLATSSRTRTATSSPPSRPA